MDPQWLHGLVRKAAHVVLYFILAVLLRGWQIQRGKAPWLALVMAVVFSLIDEGTKPLVVGRYCDIEDILLNDVGAVYNGPSVKTTF